MAECPHGMDDPSWCGLCLDPRGDVSYEEPRRMMVAKYAGICSECRQYVNPGDDIGWTPLGGKILCEECV